MIKRRPNPYRESMGNRRIGIGSEYLRPNKARKKRDALKLLGASLPYEAHALRASPGAAIASGAVTSISTKSSVISAAAA